MQSAQSLAELARNRVVLFGITMARQGRADLAVAPVMQPVAEPVAILLGAPAVRELEVDVATLASRFGAIICGRPRVPAVAVPLAARSSPEWNELASVLDFVGVERIARATGIPFAIR